MLPPANVKLPWSGGNGDSKAKVAFVATSAAFGALIVLLIVLLAFVMVRRRRRSRDGMLSEVRLRIGCAAGRIRMLPRNLELVRRLLRERSTTRLVEIRLCQGRCVRLCNRQPAHAA